MQITVLKQKIVLNKLTYRILSLVLAFIPISILAQDDINPVPAEMGAEKIYLQLTTKTCAIGQIVWFKAVVTDAEIHVPTKLSQVLYVEMVDEHKRIISRKIVKLSQGIGYGQFKLDAKYKPGRYLLRAYTNWNRNFGDDFVFSSYIAIYQVSKSSNAEQSDLISAAGQIPVLQDKASIPPIEVYFFPESGKMVHGVKNKIGFKAVGTDGLGLRITGNLYDSEGERMVSFKSNHLGMGYFFVKADSTLSYKAEIFGPSSEKPLLIVDLPKVESYGSILAVNKLKNRIRLNVFSNAVAGKIFIKVSRRGVDHYLIEGHLNEGELTTELPADKLPVGIIVFTLLDKNNMPLAERLFFNATVENSHQLNLDTDKTVYAKREAVELNIKLKGNTASIPKTDLSVKVLNSSQWGGVNEETILSYFLLSSELKGPIEQPGHYFEAGLNGHFPQLDALLLTQGWRNYKYPLRQLDTIFYQPEQGISVKGAVFSKASKKNKPMPDLTLNLAVFGERPTYYQQQTDSLGQFNFLLDDTYGMQHRMLLQGNDQGNPKKNIAIFLDTVKLPKVNYSTQSKVHSRQTDSVLASVVLAGQRRINAQSSIDTLLGVTRLDEVVLEGYKMTAQREQAYKDYGKPDAIIAGDAIRRHEKEWSYGVFGILLFEYPDLIQIERFSDGFMLAHINHTHTLIAVDGRLIRDYEYTNIQDMPPSIVESVEIMQFVPFFKRKYIEVFPGVDLFNAPAIGHVITIFTKNNIGLAASDKPINGMLNTMTKLFSPIKEFYVPKYDQTVDQVDKKQDLRSLIHWEPSITTDESGHVSVRFYNGDIEGDYIIVVEAISEDGQIAYAEKLFTVEQ